MGDLEPQQEFLVLRTSQWVFEVRRAPHREHLLPEGPGVQAIFLAGGQRERATTQRLSQFFGVAIEPREETFGGNGDEVELYGNENEIYQRMNFREELRSRRYFTNDIYIAWSFVTGLFYGYSFSEGLCYFINQNISSEFQLYENQIENIPTRRREKTFLRCSSREQMEDIMNGFVGGIFYQGMMGSTAQAFRYAPRS